ncbi:hypothetical protein [Pseudanabaena sp. PCC 6802]|uniref:hypothetical protein n=1 Tax=Pseudanabaena sp. PCC 6802 TaxID=118173 RepID=UPI00034BF90F|nr:hypothetical protein [Pseudanabaena sp. PCC 6802]
MKAALRRLLEKTEKLRSDCSIDDVCDELDAAIFHLEEAELAYETWENTEEEDEDDE